MKFSQKKNRLRELDFLRGIAILLVLLRHVESHQLIQRMGWIGVDLFFVLSGFLVSGLLFKEYNKTGKINAKRFLIRRGFKIYPIYYLSFIPYLLIKIKYNGTILLEPILGELFFAQNYLANGWGYLNSPSWSLAVEEHFYIGLAIVFLALSKTSFCKQYFKISYQKKLGKFEYSIIILMLICLMMRYVSNIYFPDFYGRNYTMTHLRIDSLMAGVLLAYIFSYKKDMLYFYLTKYKYFFTLIALTCLSWTPFVEPLESELVRIFGFSLIYIAFSIILGLFLVTNNINTLLNSVLTEKVVNVIAKIGFSSYSIYLFHTGVNRFVGYEYGEYFNKYTFLLLTSIISILVGILITYTFELFFLKIRDRLFPSNSIVQKEEKILKPITQEKIETK